MSEGARITCEQVQELLLQGEEHEDHLDSCPACRSFVARLALVDAALVAGDPRPDPVPQVPRAVMNAVLVQENRRLRHLDLGLAAAAVACSAFLGGSLYWLLQALDFSGVATAALGGISPADFSSVSRLQTAVDLAGLSLPADFTMVVGVLTAVGASVLLRVMATEV